MKRKLFALLLIGQLALLLPSCGRLACADLQTAQQASWRIKIGKYQGSGTAISPRIVATARHLATHVGDPAILWRPGTVDQQVTGKVVSVASGDKDVSLIELDGETTQYVQCGNDPQRGQHVVACGYGHNAIGRSGEGNVTGDYDRFSYEASVVIESGDSGGGIFDDSGNLVGVISGTSVKPPPGQITKGPVIAIRVSCVKELTSKPAQNSSPLRRLRLLFFHASWCGPCRQMEPTVRQLATEGVDVQEIDVDQNRATASQYGVSGIPAFVAVDEQGSEVGRITGGTSKAELESLCHWQQQNQQNQMQPWSQQPQNPQGMVPLQGNSAKDAEQDQKIAAIEGWIGNANGTANPILNRFGKPPLPPLAPSSGSPQVPAQPNAPPPISAAPAPSIDLLDAAKQAFADQAADIKSKIDDAKSDIQSKIPGAPAIGAAAKPFIDQAITAAIPIIIEKAGPIINAAAPSLLAQFGPAGGIAGLLLGGFTLLWRKIGKLPTPAPATPSAPAPDIAGIVKPMFDIFGSQIVGAINSLGAKLPLPIQFPSPSPIVMQQPAPPQEVVMQTKYQNVLTPIADGYREAIDVFKAQNPSSRWPDQVHQWAELIRAGQQPSPTV